jgi:hypothetical protein
LIELLVVIVIMAALIGQLSLAVQKVRKSANHTCSQDNIHKWVTAADTVNDQTGQMPPWAGHFDGEIGPLLIFHSKLSKSLCRMRWHHRGQGGWPRESIVARDHRDNQCAVCMIA